MYWDAIIGQGEGRSRSAEQLLLLHQVKVDQSGLAVGIRICLNQVGQQYVFRLITPQPETNGYIFGIGSTTSASTGEVIGCSRIKRVFRHRLILHVGECGINLLIISSGLNHRSYPPMLLGT